MIVLARASILAAAVASALLACATIDPPAAFVDREAGVSTATRDGGAYERCRLLERRLVTDARARIYGVAPAPQAVCVTLEIEIPSAGAGVLLFCVAGDLSSVEVPSVHDLVPDLSSCAYCADLSTNCTLSEAGESPECTTSYAVLTGQARVVRLGKAPGDEVWIDVGDLEVARVQTRTPKLDVVLLDCLFADALTIQGVLEQGTTTGCTGVEATACSIASTAGARIP